jgi:hypothetical protein
MELFLKKVQSLIEEGRCWVEEGQMKREEYYNYFLASEIALKGESWLQLYYQAYLIFIEGALNHTPSFLAKYLMHIEEWASMPTEKGHDFYRGLKSYHLLFLINQEIDTCQGLIVKLTRIESLLLLLQKLNMLLDKKNAVYEAFLLKYSEFLSDLFVIDYLMSHQDELEHMLIDLLMFKNDIMTAHVGLVEELCAFEQGIENYLWRLNHHHSPFFLNYNKTHKIIAIKAFQEALIGKAILEHQHLPHLMHGRLGELCKRFPHVINFLKSYQDNFLAEDGMLNAQKKHTNGPARAAL